MENLQLLRSSLPYRAMNKSKSPMMPGRAPSVDYICFRSSGGIGDMLLCLGPALELAKKCSTRIVFYSKWPEIARLFSQMDCRHEDELMVKGNPISDCVISMSSIGVFHFTRNFRGFKNKKLESVFIENQHFMYSGLWKEIAMTHPYMDHFLAPEADKLGLNRETVGYRSLGLNFSQRPRPKFRSTKMSTVAGFYITVHNGYDTNHGFKGPSTKNWSTENWGQFVSMFKQRYPACRVIQIGALNSGVIPNVDLNLVGLCSFEESLAVLRQSACHVDSDSGLTHAAAIIGIRSVVLFGPTPAKFFQYDWNKNLTPRDICKGNCWWVNADWMNRCPVGFDSCQAIDSITPKQVFESVLEIL